MSGDFAYSNQYTLNIDDNLTEAQDSLGGLSANDCITPLCAVMPRCCCITWMSSENYKMYFVTCSNKGVI